MKPTTAQYDQLIASLYAAAMTLVAAVTDPVALEQASLRHRAAALNAVSNMLARVSKAQSAMSDDWRADIEFVFDEPEEGYTEPFDWQSADPFADDLPPAAASVQTPSVPAASTPPAPDRPAREPIGYDRALELTIRGARFDDGRTPFVYADEDPDATSPSHGWPEHFDTHAG